MSGHTGRSFTGAALVFLGLETFAVGFLFFGFCGSSLFPVGERVQAIVCPNPSQGTAPGRSRARAILCRHGQRRKPLINFATWRNVGAALRLIVSGVRAGVC